MAAGRVDAHRVAPPCSAPPPHPLQVCKAGQPSIRKIFLTRHGQSEYNVRELLGGDSNISAKGEMYAVLLPAALLTRLPEGEGARLSVWTSTLKRTIQTAQNLPFPKLQWCACLPATFPTAPCPSPPPHPCTPTRAACAQEGAGRDQRRRVRRHDVRGDR